MIIISEFGIKIKNISAGTLYDVNLGTRDYFSYTEAMLNNSLFSAFLIKNGLNVYKGESTRDIICLDFDFGTRSYEDEHKRIEQLYKNSDGELKERLKYTLEKVENNKDLYDEKKREQIRDKFYNEGVDVTYKTKNKDGTIKSEETIHYEMLFRTSAKAKLGQVIFINSELYEVAYEWLTIGLGKLMTDDNAKIVEMSAYAPLTTSTIVGTKYIPVEDILILRDQDSFFKTMANIVRAEDYIDSKGRIGKKCVVDKKVTEVKNTLWDGMGLIEADYFKDCRNAYNPEWTVKINGMALMRHHLFKMCGFKSHIQLFFKDWCEKTGNDYETYQIQDMFGHWHYLKDILAEDYNRLINLDFIYCPHCGKFKSIKADNFYSSNETVDGIEHFACRECIINMCTDRDKNGNRIDNKAKTIDTFRRLNWYFNEDDYEAQLVKVKEGVKEKLRSTAAQQLIVIVQSLPQYKSMTFAQSKFNDSSDDIPAYKRKPRKEIVKLFGSGLSNEDYLYLQDQYDDWCERTQVDSKSQQTYIVRICFKLLDIWKAQKSSKDTTKLDESLNKLMDAANLQPRQNVGNAATDALTFSQLIEKWEQEKPIPEPDPEFKDCDGIGKYIRVWFKGALSHALGLESGYSKEYEDYVSQYAVTKPEEQNLDEKSESIYSQIFGDESQK